MAKDKLNFTDGFEFPAGPARTDARIEPTREPEPVGENRPTEPNSFETFSPFEFEPAGTDPEPAPRRRGRPAGSTNRKTAQASGAVAHLDGLLYSVYYGASRMFDAPEFELSETAAKQYANSITKVLEQYEKTIDPRKSAIAELCICIGAIHAPMVKAYAARKKAESGPRLVKPEPKEPPTPIRQTVNAPPAPPQPMRTSSGPTVPWSSKPLTEMSPSELNPALPGNPTEGGMEF